MSTNSSPFTLDRPGIRDAFDRASTTYQSSALLQARVSDELIERLGLFCLTPELVLDLGCGPGRGALSLERLYPRARICALDFAPGMLREAGRARQAAAARFDTVCGDALRLPFATGSADVIFSSLMLQWCEPLSIAFSEIARVLKVGGLLMFATFGPDTLRELREAWAAADAAQHVNSFLDMHDVGDALLQAGLAEPVLDIERMLLTYGDARALMRELKAIGAHNVAEARTRGLTSRSKLQRMEEAYERCRHDGRLPATYEVVYGTAWGRAPTARGAPGEHYFSPDEIRRRG